MRPLLSVVIPTKNRYVYLKDCIQTLSNIDLTNIEVIIQDNTMDNKEILPHIPDQTSSNIRYFHTTDDIGMSENASRAIENSTGKYLLFIGDDDTICSNIIMLVKIMENQCLESCVFTLAKYYWVDNKYSDQGLPNLQYAHTTGEIHIIDAKDELKKVLGGSFYGLGNMPKIYHGIVSRKAMEKVKLMSGSYFPGPSPDMANAVALSLVVQKHAIIDLIVIISGYGGNSGGNRYRGIRIDESGKIPWLPKDIALRWSNKLPRTYTNQIIWVQSAIEALKSMGKYEEYEPAINFEKVYAQYLAYIPKIKDIIALKPSTMTLLKTFIYLLPFLTRRMKSLISRKITKKLEPNILYEYNIATITEAQEYINKYNEDNGQI